jgi:hypothetical protein
MVNDVVQGFQVGGRHAQAGNARRRLYLDQPLIH